MNRKLFIVDPQNGFMDDGSLPVAGSHARMEALGQYLDSLDIDYYDHITVSLDWHPLTHCSFAEKGGPWPQHCVAFTNDALVTPEVMQPLMRWMKVDKVDFITKGKDRDIEEYSALDNDQNAECIRMTQKETDVLDVCGVVGTVCVQNTLKGMLEREVISADKICVLPKYTAQFSDKDETEFLAWANSVGLTIG